MRCLASTFLVFVSFICVASGQEELLGTRVFLKDDAQPKLDGEAVSPQLIATPALITEVQVDKLSLGRAWVLRSEVLTIDQAIDYFTAQIDQNASSAAYAGRGAAWREKGQLDNAFLDFAEAIKLDPKNSFAFRNRGNAWSDRGDLDAALKDFTTAISLNPKFAIAYINRGIAKEGTGKLEDALLDYAEAIRLDPGNFSAYNNRGLALRAKGETAAAIKDHTEAIRLNPRYAFLYYNRGIANRSARDFEAAIDDFDEAIRIDAKFALAMKERGITRLEKGDLNGAIRDLSRAIKADPEYADAFHQRSKARESKGDLDEAIEDLTKAISIDPTAIDFLIARARVRAKKDDFNLAIEDCSTAIELEPANKVAYYQRGVQWVAKKEFDAALTDFTKAILLDPNYSSALVQRGTVWSNKGDIDAALKDYSQAIIADPKNALAYASRGHAWQAKADLVASVKDFTEALRIDPTLTDLYFSRGKAFHDQHDYSAAIRDFTELIRLYPKTAKYYVGRAASFRSKESPRDAIRDFEAALVIEPMNEEFIKSRDEAWLEVDRQEGYLKQHDYSIESVSARIAKGSAGTDRERSSLAMGYESRAFAWRHIGNIDASLADFTSAFDILVKVKNSEDYKWLLNEILRGRIETNLLIGETELAIKDCEYFVQLDQENIYGSLNWRSRAWLEHGDFEKSLADAEKSKELALANDAAVTNRSQGNQTISDGQNVEGVALCLIGEIASSKGDFASANDLFLKARMQGSNGATAYRERLIANAFTNLGEFDKAIERLAIVKYCDSDVSNARAKLYVRTGDFESASKEFNTAVRFEPCGMFSGRHERLLSRARFLATCKDAKYRNGKIAVNDGVYICDLTGWLNADCLDTLAAAYAECGDFDKAVETQKKALARVRPHRQQDFQKRLKLYWAKKPFHDE